MMEPRRWFFYNGNELGKVTKRVFAKAWNIHFNGWQMFLHLTGSFEVESNGEKIIDCDAKIVGTTIGCKLKQYECIALLLLMVDYMQSIQEFFYSALTSSNT